MYVGIAILLDEKTGEISRKLTHELNDEFGTGLDFAYLLQHVSLKQSFPYEGELEELEEYFRAMFVKIRPLKVHIERLEAKEIDGKALVWMKAAESPELSGLHKQLCDGLYDKFGIEPLGYDGEQWEFHSTIAFSEADENIIQQIISRYNNRALHLEFTAREAVMFCSLNINIESWLCFAPKKFQIGKLV